MNQKQHAVDRSQESGDQFRETDEIVCAKFNARFPVGSSFDVIGENGSVINSVDTIDKAFVHAIGIPLVQAMSSETGLISLYLISALRHRPAQTLKSIPVDVAQQPNYAANILQDAKDAIDDRAAERDQSDGERSIVACVDSFNALTGHNLSEREGWVFMALLKLARAQHGALKTDDYIDGAAYMSLAGEAAIRAEKNAQTQTAIDNDLAAHDEPSVPVPPLSADIAEGRL